MSEELGKIEKPQASQYSQERKLFFIPLVFAPREPQPDLMDIVTRYWDQVQEQVTKLESKLGEVNRVYHELIPIGGEHGAQVMEELNPGSCHIVKARLARGAELQPLEDSDLLTEFMDWSKCLAVGLQNQKVFNKIHESYMDVQKARNEYIARQIGESLKDGESGILLMREGHHIQFPSDIQVFYVSPPALDEIKRWIRSRQSEAEREFQDQD